MEDVGAAGRIDRTLRLLAGVEPEDDPDPLRRYELATLAAERLNCLRPEDHEEQGRRKILSKLALRRILFMAASQYRWCVDPPQHSVSELVSNRERDGLRSILILGGDPGLAASICRSTGQRVTFVPPEESVDLEADPDVPVFPEIPDLQIADPVPMGRDLPFFLAGRFQTVIVQPPLDAVGARKALTTALSAFDGTPNNRLYWMGHPARNQGYFGLYSLLGRRGWMLQRLETEARSVSRDPTLTEEVLTELVISDDILGQRPEALLEELTCGGLEFEHLHLFRRGEEMLLRGQVLDFTPLLEADVPLFDSWLTPEFCAEIGLEDDRPRATAEELLLRNWYPENEWWWVRTKDGTRIGIFRLVMRDFWSNRLLTWDIGIKDKSLRGKGLVDDIFRIGFHRNFIQLQSLKLWALMRTTNTPLLKCVKRNYCIYRHNYFAEALGVEFEYYHFPAANYRQHIAAGELTSPEEA